MLNTRSKIQETASSVDSQTHQDNRTSDAVQEVYEHGRRIDSVIETIKDIADQTHLLALNTAIEAAQADEQGRGFAVVADEVRPLARGTKQSTEEIQSTIEKMQELVETTVSAIKDSQKMTDNMVKVSVRPQRNMHGEQKVLQK